MVRPEHRTPDPTSGIRRMAVIVTSTLLGGMIAAVGVIGSETLEPGLTANARDALDDAGFTSVDVRFDGREAFISSLTSTSGRLLAAQRVVEEVEGVRWATVVSDADAAAGGAGTPVPTATPTPTPTAAPIPPDTVRWLEQTDVLFGPDSAALTDAALTQLSQVAALLTDRHDLRLTVTGHIAIATGTEADAIAFSELRAQAVVDELLRRGARPDQLTVVGAGSGDAVGDNATPEGAASNRRVTFAIQEDS
jgi:outer membrane protein OmpA-like peptidoglycan-associated protein